MQLGGGGREARRPGGLQCVEAGMGNRRFESLLRTWLVTGAAQGTSQPSQGRLDCGHRGGRGSRRACFWFRMSGRVRIFEPDPATDGGSFALCHPCPGCCGCGGAMYHSSMRRDAAARQTSCGNLSASRASVGLLSSFRSHEPRDPGAQV